MKNLKNTSSVSRRLKRMPTWEEIGKMFVYRGWMLVEREKHKITYQRRNERIIAKKNLGTKWKAEYFIGSRMLDSTGIQNENFAKILTMEMGVSK